MENKEKLIREWRESGMNQKEWCGLKNLNLSTFRGWIHQSKRSSTEVKWASIAAKPNKEVTISANGITMQISSEADESQIMTLIRVLLGVQ